MSQKGLTDMGGFALSREDVKHAERMGNATAVAIVHANRCVDPLYDDLEVFPLTATDSEWLEGDPQRETAFRLYCDEAVDRLREKMRTE